MTFAERMDASRSTVSNNKFLAAINTGVKASLVTLYDAKEATLNGVATAVVALELDSVAAKVSTKVDGIGKGVAEKAKRYDEMSKQK